jgi:hypothetical protein
MFLSRSNASAANAPSCDLNLSICRFTVRYSTRVRGARCDRCPRRAPPFPLGTFSKGVMILKRGLARSSHHGRIRSMIAVSHRSRYAPFKGPEFLRGVERESLELMSSCCVVGRLLGLSKVQKIKQQLHVLNSRFDLVPLYSMCNLRDG